MQPVTSTTDRATQRTAGDLGAVALVAVGAVCGLSWATGLRGFMAQIAGPGSGVEWVGTFGWILAPGVLTGAVFGWAEHLRRTGGGRGWRWLATAPLLFAGVLVHGLVTAPGGLMAGLEQVAANPLGLGAIGVPLYGMVSGYALSGRGPLWGRVVGGVVGLTAIPIWALTVTGFAGLDLAVTTPRGAWVALYYWSFLAVLAFGCAIPHRPVIRPPHGGSSPGATSGSGAVGHETAATHPQAATVFCDMSAHDMRSAAVPPEQMKRQARRLAEEVFTQGDLGVVGDVISGGYVDHGPALSSRTGPAGLTDRVTALRRAFPDLYLIVEDQIAEADRVVTRSTARGTHTGEFLGVEPTGRRVVFEVIDVNRVGDDGRIAEHWAAVDTHSLLQQLGALRSDPAA